jgi:hypothetical protein
MLRVQAYFVVILRHNDRLISLYLPKILVFCLTLHWPGKYTTLIL